MSHTVLRPSRPLRRLLLVLALSLALPAQAAAADLHATPATFASTFSSAQPGDTILLASGNYGTWGGTNKAITVKADSGATPTMRVNFGSGDSGFTLAEMHGMGGSIGGAQNITIKDSEFTDRITYDGGSGVVLDHNTHNNLNFDAGRVQVVGDGLTVQNSLFRGGCSDGLQVQGANTRIIGNEFDTLIANCSNHTDMIQFYGSGERNTLVRGNWFHGHNQVGGSAHGVLACYDGNGNGCVNETIEDNVIDVTGGGERAWQIELYADVGSTVRHNTLVAGSCEFNIRCGTILITHKSGSPASNGTQVYDNIATVDMDDTVNGRDDHNMIPSSGAGGSGDFVGSPTFVGGANPTTYAGFALAANSPGKGRATDGLDVGARFGGSAPPPPPPPPPADTTPPNTSISSGPADPSSSTSATLAFTSDVAGSTFECKLDAGAFASCSSAKSYSALSAGSHTFSVRATDAAGNVDATPATWTWTIDTTPPPPPPPPPPPSPQCSDGVDNDGDGQTDFPDDPGCSSATDTTESPNPTTDHQPSARFTFSPTSPVIGHPVTFDATSSTCEDTPCTYTWVDDGFDGSGGSQWPLGNGRTLAFTFRGASTKNVRVTVTDADGDTDTTVRAISVTAAPTPPPPDTTPPPPDTTPPPVDDTPPDTTITLGPSGTTNDATPTFAFTSSEPDPAFECLVDSGSWMDCASPWTTVTLSDGVHSVSVRSTDVAGNTDSTPATRSFVVDTGPSGGRLLLGSSTVQPVADSNPAGSAEAFEATASGAGSAVELSIYVDSGSTATAMVAGIYSDAGGHPGTLLTKGMLSAPAPLAWNDITVPDASLVSGQKYWLALLGLGDGSLRFRDGLGIGCHSEGSRSATLTTLPATWQTGSAWASCNFSGHASG